MEAIVTLLALFLGLIIAVFAAGIACKQERKNTPEDDEEEDLPRVVVMQEVPPVLKRRDRGSDKR